MANPNQDARGGDGKYVDSLDTATQDAAAARLRTRGYSYREIALELGISKSSVHDAVQRALRAVRTEGAEELRALELARLDAELLALEVLEAAVMKVLERQHVTVSHGQVVYYGEEPLLDDGPILQAVDRLVKINESRRRNGESRRKLTGADAPASVAVGGTVTYELVGIDLNKLS